jgi:hypothetical protein
MNVFMWLKYWLFYNIRRRDFLKSRTIKEREIVSVSYTISVSLYTVAP